MWDYCLSRTKGKIYTCYIDIYHISVQYKDISPKALCGFLHNVMKKQEDNEMSVKKLGFGLETSGSGHVDVKESVIRKRNLF